MNFILDTEKIRSLAKPGHVRCHGNGISGYTQGGTAANVCSCVRRAMEKRGIDVRNEKEVRAAIGKEELVSGLEAKTVIRDEVGAC